MATKWRRIAATALALSAVALCPQAVTAQPDSAEQARMMARAMELALPGPEHKLLEKLAGNWNFKLKMWPTPGSEPMLFEGTSKSHTILGGRFLLTEAEGPSPAGTAESMGLLGFDRRFGHFTTIGLDTWGTYYVTGAGPYDSATHTITMSGEDYDPVFKGTQLYDFVVRLVNDDEFVWEIIFKDEWHTQGGGPFKMVEIVYTRAK